MQSPQGGGTAGSKENHNARNLKKAGRTILSVANEAQQGPKKN